MTVLSFQAEGPSGPAPHGGPLPFKLALVNVSPAAVTVNARMGVGYEDGFERDVYFTVYDHSGTHLPVPDEVRVDVHRGPPGADDFRRLAPGENVVASVNLSFWYPFPQPGEYQVIFTYENRHDGAELGLDAWTGTLDALPLTMTLV